MSKKTILRFIAYILAIAMLLAGLLIFTYPLLSGYVSDRNTATYIDGFEKTKSSYTEEKKAKSDTSDKFDELYAEMQKYNKEIYKNGQEGLCDAWAYEQSSIDLSQYGIYNGVVGVLRVPKMNNLEMPILLGASRNNMSRGATQLGETSMPIGGNNTNCVLAGHRGWNGARYFLDIEQVELGDMVYVENLWETLSYKVTDIKIINPDDIDKILIQDNKDMLTLFTCHPYWASTYRYAVYCTRVSGDTSTEQTATSANPQQKTETAITTDKTSDTRIFLEKFSYIAIPLILIALYIVLFLIKKRR